MNRCASLFKNKIAFIKMLNQLRNNFLPDRGLLRGGLSRLSTESSLIPNMGEKTLKNM